MKTVMRICILLLSILLLIPLSPAEAYALEEKTNIPFSASYMAVPLEEPEVPAETERFLAKIKGANLLVIGSASALLLLNYRKQV